MLKLIVCLIIAGIVVPASFLIVSAIMGVYEVLTGKCRDLKTYFKEIGW